MNPECAVLGALLLAPECFWSVAELVTDADFLQPQHRRLWLAIRDQLSQGKPADAIMLGEDYPDLSSFAVELASTSPGAGNVLGWAGIVKRDGERQRIQQAGKRIAISESYDEALALLDAVRPTQTAKLKTARDGLREMVAALQARYDGAEVTGIPTGLATLDTLTGGWQPGNLVVIAGRPGMGKSALMVQSCAAAGRALLVSLEMTACELTERLVSHVGHVPLNWLRKPLDAPEYASGRVLEASRPVSSMPLMIDDSTGLTVEIICSRARQAHLQSPLRLVVVDHLGLVSRPGIKDASELGQVTSALKRLAKDLAIPVLLLCQLNRGLEQRADKRPTLADLRDSGRIEEDSDVVIALYRERYYREDADDLAEAIVLKARSGERGTAWARADLGVMRFEPAEARPKPVVHDNSSANTRRGPRGFSAGKDRQAGSDF